jgi:HEAT repeat protein
MMVERDLQTKVACYVASLASADWENAWHSLLEVGPESLPYVRQAYNDAIDDRSRELLIQVLAEKRDKESLGLFRGALHSSSSAVWKAALDAIVSVDGPAAVEILRAIESSVSKDRRRWISEALRQIE